MTRVATGDKLPSDGNPAEARELLSMRDAVLDRWEAEVRSESPGMTELPGPVFLGSLTSLYDHLAEAISPGRARGAFDGLWTAAAAHGSERARLGAVGPDDVMREFLLLQGAIREVAREREGRWPPEIWTLIDRAIETASRESLRAYAAARETLRRRPARVVLRDMRLPLSAILTGTRLIELTKDMRAAQIFAEKISHQADRLDSMIKQLLDALADAR